MASEIPRRTPPDGGPPDAPESGTRTGPFAEEQTFLDSLLEALRVLGGLHATIRQPYGMGVPYLYAEGGGTIGRGEDIRLRRVAEDGSLRAVWPWGQDLPTDPVEAAKAVRRVVKPEM